MIDLPVIKTFFVDGGYFLYETFSNRLYRISKEHYLALEILQKIGISKYQSLEHSKDADREISEMLDRGLIRGSQIDCIEHSETENIPYLLNSCISYLLLGITKNCNYRCRYCIFTAESKLSRQHERINMSWNTAKKGIDFLYEHSSDSRQIALAFYGGEPLLNFDLIKKSVRYVKSLFYTKNISFFLTTNASLLNEQIIDFFIENDFFITISLDGPEEIQKKHRIPLDSEIDPYKCVVDAVDLFKKKSGDFYVKNVSFNSVLLPDEDSKQIDRYFQGMNISHRNYEISYADLRGIDYLPRSDFPKRLLDLDAVDPIAQKNHDRIIKMLENHSHISGKYHPNGPCVPGVVRLFLSADGRFYPCEKTPEKECVSIGDLKQGINISRVVQFSNICKLTEDNCKNCWAMRLCSMCVIGAVDLENNCVSATEKNKHCENAKSSILNSLKMEARKLI